MEAVSRWRVFDQLRRLGVEDGGVLLVHASFSRVGPVERGPEGLIEALRAAVGARGTLVMPSLSDDDGEPFDPTTTPCRAMGVVADRFWRLPGVRRSDSPHAFAAAGAKAAAITAPHPEGVPHGLDSPVGRVLEEDGKVLLLGVGHDANTTIHLAESLAGVPYRRRCCARFALVDHWLEEARRQRRGPVGYAVGRLARSRHIVEEVTARLAADPAVFLHPTGTDAACDEARARIA